MEQTLNKIFLLNNGAKVTANNPNAEETARIAAETNVNALNP